MDDKLVKEAKVALRMTTDDADLAADIWSLIEAAFADLRVAGVANNPPEGADYSPLYKRAVILYCKANFGSNPDAEKLQAAYESLKTYMSLDNNYRSAEI